MKQLLRKCSKITCVSRRFFPSSSSFFLLLYYAYFAVFFFSFFCHSLSLFRPICNTEIMALDAAVKRPTHNVPHFLMLLYLNFISVVIGLFIFVVANCNLLFF